MGWRVKAVAIALFVAVVAVLAAVLGLGSSNAARTATASHRALAQTEASRLLARVALPTGSQTLPASGAGAGTAPLQRIGAPAAPNVADRSRTWTVPGTAATVDAFLRAHAVAGTRLSVRAHSSGTTTSGDLVFTAVHPPTGVSAEQVGVSLAADGPHTTLVHVDATATWVVARPASEVVPAAAHELDIVRGVPGRPAGIALTVTDPQLTAIRKLINALATVQPGTVHCPPAVPGLARVAFVFRTHAGGQVLAAAGEDADVVAPTTACDPLEFSVGGRARTPLLGGAPLLREVSRIVGHRLWLAPYAA
jgi:hypothetical protein